MLIHRNPSMRYALIMAAWTLVLFACSFISGTAPNVVSAETAAPTETSELPQVLLSPNSVPMPGGLILKSATDTERDLHSYQVAYLEDQADGFLPENQGEVDMYFGENHQFTVHTLSGGQPLVWATGWCAQGQETLSQNLEKIEFEMSVNGQPVDLAQVYRSENVPSWHTTGSYCLLYRIVVSGWTSDTTALTSRTIINETVNDGIKDYQAGSLTRTYEVVYFAQAGEVLGAPSSGMPTLGSQEETLSAIDQNVNSLTSLAEGTPFSYNGTTRYNVGLDGPNEKALWWSNGWCATDANLLAQNLEQMRTELYVNDQLIDTEDAVPRYFSSDGLPCFGYVIVVYNWPSGTTVLTSKITMEAALYDGVDNYQAGDGFMKSIVVTIP